MFLLNNNNLFVADFGTNDNEEKGISEVYLWGVKSIYNENFDYGFDLKSFFNHLNEIGKRKVIKVFFHNLKWQGSFILHYLFKNGYRYVSEFKNEPYTFKTVITSIGAFYTIKVKLKYNTVVEFVDSMKIIDLKIEDIPKSFDLDLERKDTVFKNALEGLATLVDVELLHTDCLIVAKALLYFFDKNLNKNTIGANAILSYTKIIRTYRDFYKENLQGIDTIKGIRDIFPKIEDEEYDKMRKASKGGFMYLNEQFKNKILGNGFVIDVNALYGYMLSTKAMPYGKPIYGEGMYIKDEEYPLYIQSFSCRFSLKEGKLPFVEQGNKLMDLQRFLRSENEIVQLTLCSVDFELFLQNYNVEILHYYWHYKFRSSKILFSKYVGEWHRKKVYGKESYLKGEYQVAKSMLNNLPGKFATSHNNLLKVPVMKNEQLCFELVEEKRKRTLYLPVYIFTTAYGRDFIINYAQQNLENFIYSDTDSIHMLGDIKDLKGDIEIDNSKIGAFKVEHKFEFAKYLKLKTYLLECDKKKVVCVASLPEYCHNQINFNNFNYGTEIKGKYLMTQVKGGMKLIPEVFTLLK